MANSVLERVHAIQLEAVETRELFIRLNGPVLDSDQLELIYKKEVQLRSAFSPFDENEKQINVGLQLSLGMEEDTSLPVSMRVEIIGAFKVNTEEFPVDQIDSWAKKNAPLILYPFVREQSFGLTTRCGLPQIILPLLQVPTLNKKREK